MKAMWLALGVTAGFAALARTQDRPGGEGAEACEVRVWLVDPNKNPAPLRNVSAAIVVPGKAGAPDRSTPMIIEVPLKSDPPGKDGKAVPPQTAPVQGTIFTAEALVFKHVPASDPEEADPEGPRAPREGPYFRAVLERALLGDDGAFRVVFTIHGEKRVAKGFTCHLDGAKVRKYYQDLDRAVAARDADRAKAALDRLGAELAKAAEEDPHRDLCEKSREGARAAIDARDWEAAARCLETCRQARADCSERCAPAPSDERRRP